MSRFEIVEHARYLGDQVKLTQYDAALGQTVTAESRVLDLGSGSGILGLMAARHGAAKVYSVDYGDIATTTAAVAARNGYRDRITVVQESSTTLTLPEPVDVIVCDQIGGMVYDAGVLEHFHDVRRRLAAPGATLIPGSFDLLAAPIDASFWDEVVDVWRRGDTGFDFDPMFQIAANTEFRPSLEPGDFLGPASCWGHVESDSIETVEGGCSVFVERAGTLKGIAGMFIAHLGTDITLTNCPLLPCHFRRWQNLYPLRDPVRVDVGDRVDIHLDLRPAIRLVNWRVEVYRPTSDSPVSRQRGSTALGGFVTAADLGRSRRTRVPSLSEHVQADRTTLALVDGNRSLGEIVELVWARHPGAFTTINDVERRVHMLLRHPDLEDTTWPSSPTA